MTRRLIALALGALSFSYACAADTRRIDRPAIRVGYSGEADFGDLPSFLAHERLRARGFELEVTHYSAPDLALEALARGSADVIHGTMLGAWTAAARGAHIRTVASQLANPYRFVSASSVTRCADLDGRPIALAGESAVSTLLVRAYLAEECPAARPIEMAVMESTSRAAALLSGRLAAAAIDLNTVLWLQARAADRFRMLSDFSTRWPGVETTGVHVNTQFADAHPDVVAEYVTALEIAKVDISADRALLVSIASKHLGSSGDWQAVADAYASAGAWPTRKGLARADVLRTLSFYQTYGGVPVDTSPDAVVRTGFFDQSVPPADE